MSTPDRTIRSLDGLRAVAIALVILGHVAPRIFLVGAGTGAIESRLLGQIASAGVGLFFGISGFLITTLLLGEAARGGIDLVRFYARRAVRLWPALWTYLATIGILAVAGLVTVTGKSVLAAVFFASDYTLDPTVPTFHLWSLAIEEQFYLIWPAVLVVAGVSRSRVLLIVAIVAAPLVRVASYVLVPSWRVSVDYQFHQRYDLLALGCLLGMVWCEPTAQAWISRRGRALIGWGVTAVVVASIGNAALGGGFILIVGVSLLACGFAAIVAGAVTSTGLAGRAFNSKAMIHLGRVSYGLYLWQQVFILAPFSVFKTPAVGVLGAILAAELSYRLVEVPMGPLRRWLRPRTRTRGDIS